MKITCLVVILSNKNVNTIKIKGETMDLITKIKKFVGMKVSTEKEISEHKEKKKKTIEAGWKEKGKKK